MIEYATRHLWNSAAPNQFPDHWILTRVLRLDEVEGYTIPQVIYGANQHFRRLTHRYYDQWNSARADLVAKYVDPPPGRVPDIPLVIRRPKDADPAEWVLTVVMGFTLEELEVFKSLNTELTPGRQNLPLLKYCCLILHRMRMKDPLLDFYHRTRYLMGKYYLEYHYHERLIRDELSRVRRRKRPE